MTMTMQQDARNSQIACEMDDMKLFQSNSRVLAKERK